MGEGQHRKDATNEELASQAKTGDRAALAALWEQNRGLLAVLFRRLYIRAGARVNAVFFKTTDKNGETGKNIIVIDTTGELDNSITK